jgi:anaerobic selenocysteine-containing dehydrogenase
MTSSRDRPLRLSRRRALQAAALGTFAGCRPEGAFDVSQPPPPPGKRTWDRREERRRTTTCGQCPAGCSIDVRVVEGRAVSITGVDSPVNRGGVGPRGISSLQALYDPDRIRTPLIRRGGSGARASRPLEPATWDEAEQILVERLKTLRDESKSREVFALCGRDRGMMLELWRRFGSAYGTPHVLQWSAWSLGALPLASELMFGVRELPGYEYGEVDYLLTLGSGVLETACQRVYFLRAAADMVRGRKGRRAHVVHADPALPDGTTLSDEWLPISSCTHGLLALALCHTLIRDELYDVDAAARFAGFEDEEGRVGFKTWVSERYSPEAVAPAIGVPAATIERIAAEMAARQPAIAVLDPTSTLTANGLNTARAVLSLNALLGAFDRAKGRVVLEAQPPLSPWPSLSDAAPDASPDAPLDAPPDAPPDAPAPVAAAPRLDLSPEELPEMIAAGKPHPVQALLLYYANPAYSGVSPKRWSEALAKVPFIASFSPYLDETVVEHADLVLPDATPLERWEDGAPAPAVGPAVFPLRQPVVEPRHESRATGDVLLSVAQGLGDDVAAALPWKSFRKAVEARCEGLQQAQRGSIVASSPRKFFKKLRKVGLWVDDAEGSEEASRPTALSSPAFVDSLRQRGLDKLGPDFDEALAHLPNIPIGEPESTGELTLVPYTPSTYSAGSGANQSWLRMFNRDPRTTPAEINPELAARLGLKDGDAAKVESGTASIDVRVVVFAGVRPDCVRIPRGLGHRAMGRWAKGFGSNVMDLLAPRLDPWTGLPIVFGQKVTMRRV